MAIVLCKECGQSISDKAFTCPHCGCPIREQAPVAVQQNNSVAVTVDEHPLSEVLTHLEYAKELEAAKYSYQCSRDRIRMRMATLGHHREVKPPEETLWGAVLGGLLFACCMSLIGYFIIYAVVFVTKIPDGLFTIDLVDCGKEALKITGGLAAALAVGWIVIKAVPAIYCQHLYQKALKADDKRVAWEREQKARLEVQKRQIDQRIREQEQVLKRFYSIGILHPNYQNMIAVFTIHQYLDTRSCYRLTGEGGAYYTFEYHKRMDLIISKLEEISHKLDLIQQNQRMLYDAIQESNAIAEGIYRQSEQMMASNNRIAENTALIAYNTKVAAQNSRISAYIDAFGR